MEEHATKRRFRFGRPLLFVLVPIAAILLGFAIGTCFANRLGAGQLADWNGRFKRMPQR